MPSSRRLGGRASRLGSPERGQLLALFAELKGTKRTYFCETALDGHDSREPGHGPVPHSARLWRNWQGCKGSRLLVVLTLLALHFSQEDIYGVRSFFMSGQETLALACRQSFWILGFWKLSCINDRIACISPFPVSESDFGIRHLPSASTMIARSSVRSGLVNPSAVFEVCIILSPILAEFLQVGPIGLVFRSDVQNFWYQIVKMGCDVQAVDLHG